MPRGVMKQSCLDNHYPAANSLVTDIESKQTKENAAFLIIQKTLRNN